MEIKLTKKQYRDLLEVVLLGNWIRGSLFDQGLYKGKDYDQIEDYLITKADYFESGDLVEDFEGHPLPSEELSNRIEETMESYDDFVFWEFLERELGKRDFYETITDKEKKELARDSWFPERIHEIYAKYREEFEEHGVDRLRIVDEDTKNR
ncbi:TPA: hypothetical protein DDW69_00475 [candidate division CPR2 bacterium]|uniref:Uncharacterized protein n=1 Tax=candidate division CPR2 bacterium GW2011_GWC1_41_48 TaxID=1618344 RepID=A0A0G0W761_UNCC2|nr:MAG: hypothetical protein UT47_C0004G0095 [candidate division CPR2 bacterium GW2011_GWC2_39_35]KKR28653.1 MAG: hypothetical protein UT60_C0015G0007 [candidate division CPR2 bacterium GW2011_GWD2_39_7]KKR28791.1 MAG: hypothetical protein UT59_C0019G0012 [candidate division CPR2 bacterium GW2011_GWD1_39_7]KKS08814.1 MAG: hypothetical protein UU65_C0004G0025 [candidate division CPR2 bacterium GW2011_GWC1_41_48]OGB61404.1 MAG: hypothetical protein A2Y27_03330 [candidate division CPR2 bacterium G